MTVTPTVRSMFQAFYDADDVSSVLSSFSAVLEGINAKDETALQVFARLEERLVPELNFRQKTIFPTLRAEINKRTEMVADMSRDTVGDRKSSEVLISGGGPCGLRAAIESALCGMTATCIEKRDAFSRVNVLTLFPQTNGDLVSLGLKYFCPTHPVLDDPVFALSTRQIQLVYLKTACMLGVKVIYAASLECLVPPSNADERWSAVVTCAKNGTESGSVKGLNNTAQSTLDFKQNKVQRSGYETTTKCNAVEVTRVVCDFVSGVVPAQSKVIARIPFDGLLVAEGEWSTTTRSLGFNKTIDQFGLALGLVINLEYDPKDKAQRATRPRLESGTSVLTSGSVLHQLSDRNVTMEAIAYLKGETHYIAASIFKDSLLSFGALKSAECPSGLLSADNLNTDRLKAFASVIASVCGVPDSTTFAQHNPIQLFDYSSRSRCLVPCKLLSGRLSASPDHAVVDCSAAGAAACEQGGGRPAMVFPIGDSLLEPFWPQGLGINRGLHTALNAVYSLVAKQQQGLRLAVKEARWGFACTMYGTWTKEYVSHHAGWTADPLSRFSPSVSFHTRQMILAGDGGTRRYSADEDLPDRIQHVSFSKAVSPGRR